jgi:hypothetical protein
MGQVSTLLRDAEEFRLKIAHIKCKEHRVPEISEAEFMSFARERSQCPTSPSSRYDRPTVEEDASIGLAGAGVAVAADGMIGRCAGLLAAKRLTAMGLRLCSDRRTFRDKRRPRRML